MKKQIAMKWIKALRSGKYKQGTEQLYDSSNNSYCCLGVLCSITNSKKFRSEPFLPPHVISKVDMNSNDGKLVTYSSSLSNMNDNGASFKELADIIEANWKDL